MSFGSPPPGIDLNANIKGSILSPVIALMVISTAAVALRILAKYIAKARLQLDDYLILGALVIAWGTGCLTILACSKGVGKHIWNPTVQVVPVLQILWAYEFLYASVVPLTKSSIVFFYYRLFPVDAFRKILYVILFLVVGWWVALIVTTFVQCRPYSYFWTQYVDSTKGQCIDVGAFFMGNGIANVVTDFLILLTPIPMVWTLHMPLAKRLSVLGILTLGGFVCVAGVIRLIFIPRVFASADLTWNISQPNVWSSVEPNVGIVCACLPTLYPLARRCLPTWFGGTNIGAGSQPVYGTGPSRLRSQNGDFYALFDRSKDPHRNGNNKSEDEMGLTNQITSDQRPNGLPEDSINSKSYTSILVQRDVIVE